MKCAKLVRLFGALALSPLLLSAQINITGVADKTTYNNTVTLTIGTTAGFDYSATLNAQPVAVGTPLTFNRPDFYELRVNATNQIGGAVTSQYVRFIVLDSTRLGTETGLPTQVPFPAIASSAAEFTNGHFRLLAPASFPAGYGVPLIAWVVDEQDHAIRGNGMLLNAAQNLFPIKRGVGSGFVAHTNASGTLALSLSMAGLATNHNVNIESGVVWTTVSGALPANTSWPANSRIHINGHVLNAAGSTLTVGEGTIVRVDAGLEITNNGAVMINGTTASPVVFMGTTAAPWGGFVQHANNASFTATGAIFTGSGQEPCWYSNSDRGCTSGLTGQGSHRTEQPLVSMTGTNCSLTMTDSAAISLTGQFSKAASGSANGYTVRLTRFLLQRATSGGEYASTTMTVNDSALIEIPDDSVNFEDEDHDGLYLNSGAYTFTNTLIGWTKDDGIDSGGSGTAPLTYQSCWFEGTFHEGNSLSGNKNVFSRGTVYIGCGQGLESGYDAPTGRVDNCLFTMNQSGMRWADNYTSGFTHNGWFFGTNSISIYNHRDIFSYSWVSTAWTNSSRMNASNNWITAPDPLYPNNFVWNPSANAWRLATFGAPGRVGVGFGVRGTSLAQFPDGIPVGLSIFCTNEVTVGYEIDGTDGTHVTGTLIYPAGLTRRYIPAPTNVNGVLRIALVSPVNADVTGQGALLFQNLPASTNSPAPVVLSPLASAWKYLDSGTNLDAVWRGTNFNDDSWSSGPARLGFADDISFTTVIRKFVQTNGVNTTRQITNAYFRRSFVVTNTAQFEMLQFNYQRDDGCIVYLNSNEVFRSNMPGGPITANTFASANVSPNTTSLRFITNLASASTFLRLGTNILAAQVHQSGGTSSDMLWELELQGLPATPPPRVTLVHFGNDAVLYWNDATFGLEEADVVTGPWRPASPTNSPSASAISSNRFFRLKK